MVKNEIGVLKKAGDIRVNYISENKQKKRPEEKCFPLEKKRIIIMSNQVLQHPGRHELI